MENQEELQKEILTWAARAGQELVTIEICRAWFSQGRNDELRLHEFEDADGNVDWRAINNNRQKIFRWLRGETTAARRKTQVLASVMKAVLPAERRARLESPGDPVLLATLAAKEGVEAINAVHLHFAPELTIQEIDEAIVALVATRGAVISTAQDHHA